MRNDIIRALATGAVFVWLPAAAPVFAEQPAAAPAAQPSVVPALAADEMPDLPALRTRLIAGETAAQADLDALDALVTSGSAAALVLRGESFRRGLGRPADPQAAKADFDRALALPKPPGSVYAAYGQLLADPAGPFHDPVAALALLQKGDAAGNEAASLLYGTALIEGKGTVADAARGFALLERLAAKGSAAAIDTLADRYLSGPAADPDKAATYLRLRMAAGKGSAARQLGKLELARGNGAAALEALQRAQALGVAGLERQIAELYLSAPAGVALDQAKGRALLQTAAEKGDAQARLALVLGDLTQKFGAQSQPQAAAAQVALAREKADVALLAGLAPNAREPGVAAALDIAQTAQVFATAMAAGDGTAASGLARLLRIVPDKVPERDARIAALTALDPDKLSSLARYVDRPGIAAAQARSLQDYAALAQQVRDTPPPLRRPMLVALSQTNPNVYVYVLQGLLAENGANGLAQDGKLSGKTIRAVNSFCRAKGIGAECAEGPLSSAAIRAIGTALAR